MNVRWFFLICATVLYPGPLADAQAQAPAPAPAGPPSEHFGVGVFGGPGFPGAIGAARLSVPVAPRVGLDVDFGSVRRGRDDESGRAFGAQVRWLRKPRRSNGVSDYGVLGGMYMKEVVRSEFRFPDRTIVQFERANGLTPVVGYGWDWQSTRGARVGVELTTGGSESAGPRAFAKFFVVWGRPVLTIHQ